MIPEPSSVSLLVASGLIVLNRRKRVLRHAKSKTRSTEPVKRVFQQSSWGEVMGKSCDL